MKKHRILLWVWILMLCLPLSSLADMQTNTQYVTTVYNDLSGLPTGEANVVYQTADCYVWIGSYGGLIRYDGTTFRNFSQEGRIESSSIRSLMEDDQGRLWVGTNDAGVFVYENGQFTRVPEAGDPVFHCIRALLQSKDGTVYAASSSGLARVVDGELIPVEDPLLNGQPVYSLGQDSHGRIWAALNDWQCTVVRDGQMLGVVTSEMIFPDGQQIYAVACDQKGSIYLGSYQNVVAKVTFPAEELDASAFEVQVYSTGDVTVHNALNVTDEGDILVCGQIGFGWLSPDGSLRTFGEEASAAAINSAIRDYEGNFWLSSSSYGVIKYSLGCFDTPNHTAGLDGVMVNAITRQGDRYYLGLDNGLMVFDQNWQPVENALTQSLAGVRIRQVIGDRQGRVWLATYSANGVICYDPSDESCQYYHQETGMDSCWTRTLLELTDGSIAAGTTDGFYLLADGQPPVYYGHENGMTNDSILCFAQDAQGVLYIGTDGGGMYALVEGELVPHGSAEGLGEGVVLRLLPDEEGGMFVSAGSSLYYWQNEQFRKLTRFDKSAGSIFDFLLRDGKLWLMQNSGVLEVDKQALLAGEDADTVAYGFKHGLTGSLNANTWNYLSPEGTLYMATRSGVSLFGFQGVTSQLPSGIINDIWVDGEVYEHPTAIYLDSDTHRVTIDFAMLSYTDTAQSRIAYHLHGLDTEVTEVDGSKNGNISYTNLPGGDYTFHMYVYHPEHPDRAHHYEVDIHKEKKLTEKPLFWIGLGLAFAGLVAAIIITISHLRHQARIRRMKERQRELQAILVQSLQSFARIIDAKDPYTNGHSIRVAQYARELARRMGMSEEEQERIYYVALLHDIGKIGIPDHILNKQGSLNPEERSVIQTHPEVGGRVLADFSALEGIADGARYHHERYDGDGYCEGKKGTDIPLVARIIGVADSYDAMSSDRCYRPALSTEKIIAELEENSGTQFDPEVIPYMLSMIRDGIVPAAEDEDWQDALHL